MDVADNRIYNYSTVKFKFRDLIQKHLNMGELEKLHEQQKYEVFNRDNDQSSLFHKKFYELPENHEVFKQYRELIFDISHQLFDDETLIYQTKPTFRVHLCNNLAVGEFHKDSDYNHPIEEVNFLVPLTAMYGNNSTWIESGIDKNDFHPIKLRIGEMFCFRGGLLKHGNVINNTSQTRVSFDFRVIPKSQFKPNQSAAINTGKRFDIGDYYLIME